MTKAGFFYEYLRTMADSNLAHGYQPSAISYEPSAISYEPSAMSYEPKVRY